MATKKSRILTSLPPLPVVALKARMLPGMVEMPQVIVTRVKEVERAAKLGLGSLDHLAVRSTQKCPSRLS
jgi:hypothetical protein